MRPMHMAFVAASCLLGWFGCKLEPPNPDPRGVQLAAELEQAFKRELRVGDPEERILAVCRQLSLDCVYERSRRSYYTLAFQAYDAGRTDVVVRLFVDHERRFLRSDVQVPVFFL